jgi:hypothetical protein
MAKGRPTGAWLQGVRDFFGRYSEEDAPQGRGYKACEISLGAMAKRTPHRGVATARARFLRVLWRRGRPTGAWLQRVRDFFGCYGEEDAPQGRGYKACEISSGAMAKRTPHRGVATARCATLESNGDSLLSEKCMTSSSAGESVRFPSPSPGKCSWDSKRITWFVRLMLQIRYLVTPWVV